MSICLFVSPRFCLFLYSSAVSLSPCVSSAGRGGAKGVSIPVSLPLSPAVASCLFLLPVSISLSLCLSLCLSPCVSSCLFLMAVSPIGRVSLTYAWPTRHNALLQQLQQQQQQQQQLQQLLLREREKMFFPAREYEKQQTRAKVSLVVNQK